MPAGSSKVIANQIMPTARRHFRFLIVVSRVQYCAGASRVGACLHSVLDVKTRTITSLWMSIRKTVHHAGTTVLSASGQLKHPSDGVLNRGDHICPCSGAIQRSESANHQINLRGHCTSICVYHRDCSLPFTDVNQPIHKLDEMTNSGKQGNYWRR